MLYLNYQLILYYLKSKLYITLIQYCLQVYNNIVYKIDTIDMLHLYITSIVIVLSRDIR